MSFPIIGEQFAQRFVVTGLLGRGGFATVFRATDEATGEQVALKVLHPEDDDRRASDTHQRFLREVEIVGQLSDPHTVRLLAHGQEHGLLWAAFEYVPGEDLAELVSRVGRLNAASVRSVLIQVLTSLREAHASGLIHRDIKPENIRVSDGLAVKVLDFGIARPTDAGHPSVTRTGELVGTPRYMSPEQLYGQPLTPASDVYSVGLIGFELLAGRDALSGNHLGEQIDRLLPGYRFDFETSDRNDDELLVILRLLLDTDPRRRVSTADAALRLLKGASTPNIVVAPPKRRPYAALLGIGLVLSLVILGGLLFKRVTEGLPPAVTAAERRENPLSEVTVQETKDEVIAPKPECEARSEDGFVGMAYGGLAYVPSTLKPGSAGLVVGLPNPKQDEPERVFKAAELVRWAEAENLIMFVPVHREHTSRSDWEFGDMEKVWSELLDVRQRFCVAESAPVFFIAKGVSAGSGLRVVLESRPGAVTGAVMIGGRRRLEVGLLGKAAMQLGKEEDIGHLKGTTAGTPLLDVINSVEDPEAVDVTSSGSRYQSVAGRKRELFEVHKCEGDGEVVWEDQERVCRAYSCETPFEQCQLSGKDLAWHGHERIWQFIAEVRSATR